MLQGAQRYPSQCDVREQRPRPCKRLKNGGAPASRVGASVGQKLGTRLGSVASSEVPPLRKQRAKMGHPQMATTCTFPELYFSAKGGPPAREARSVVLDRWQPTMEQRQTKRSPSTLSMNIAPSSQPMKFLLSGSIKPSDMVVYPPESNERVQSGMEQRNAGQVQTSGPPILALTRTASISTTCLSHRGLMSLFISGTDIRCLLRTESNTSYSVLISTW